VTERAPHPSRFIRQELDERGWTTHDLASRMGGATPEEIGLDQLCVELYMQAQDKNLLLGPQTAQKLGVAFGVDPEFFINLDQAWRCDA
jgi:plasmid maintenance system antidote protein VapI